MNEGKTLDNNKWEKIERKKQSKNDYIETYKLNMSKKESKL
jgi:hypothetical protein